MRPTTPQWPILLAYSHQITTVVDSWSPDNLLLADVPIVNGVIKWDASGHIQRRLSIDVPARTPILGRLDPGNDPTHPLANYGQWLQVKTGIATRAGAELLDQGWYLITSWKRNDAEQTVTVNAEDVSRLIADSDFTEPSTPPPGATFASEFARLASPIPTATVIDPGLTDRPIPATIVWEQDRIQALQQLCEAWPARWYVDDQARAHAAPPYPPVTDASTPDVIVTDGQAGTIVDRARGGDRATIFNVTSVTGKTPAGGPPPHAVAQVTDPGSPIRVSGPYGRNVRPALRSDLITTQGQAQAAADALLARYSGQGRTEKALIIPDASIQLGNIARLFTRDGDAHTGRVTAITVPLTVDDGLMELTVSTLPGQETRSGRSI